MYKDPKRPQAAPLPCLYLSVCSLLLVSTEPLALCVSPAPCLLPQHWPGHRETWQGGGDNCVSQTGQRLRQKMQRVGDNCFCPLGQLSDNFKADRQLF